MFPSDLCPEIHATVWQGRIESQRHCKTKREFAVLSINNFGWTFVNRCVLRGCVPKKLLVYAANFPHDFESSRGFGWTFETEPKHDWKTLITNKNAELNRLTGVYKSLLQKSGVDLIEGRGKVRP